MSATSRSNQIRRARVRGVRQDYLQTQRRRFELEKHWLFRLPVYGMSPRSVWWTFQKRTRPMFPNCRLNELVQSAQRSFKLKKTYIFIFEKNSSQFPQPCSRYSLKSFIPHIDSLAKRSSQGPAVLLHNYIKFFFSLITFIYRLSLNRWFCCCFPQVE